MQVRILPPVQNFKQMKKQSKTYIILGFILLSFPLAGFSQELVSYNLSLAQVVEMGLENHQQLKIAEAQIQAGEQQVKVSKLQQLPTVSFSANAFYLGDALILDTDFSKLQTIDMPHFGNSFALQASQILYKGGVIKKSIEMAELQTQLAELDLIKDEQSIKFLIISGYLDISKIINQITVYRQNKVLAEQRLANVTKLYEEDMVTRNELIRAELQIKSIEQSILTLHNNHRILSNRLSYALNLPKDALIIPKDALIIPKDEEQKKTVPNLSYYMELAERHPSMLFLETNIGIAEKNVALAKSDYSPTISAFGGYNMQRPLTSSTPAQDLYSNTWQAGLSLTFNIDNLFKTKEKVKLGNIRTSVLQESRTYNLQNIEMEVHAAFVKYHEAMQQRELMSESQRLADENYRIIEGKYMNQLAITAEMTDAATAKLDSELQLSNAEINVLFQYYSLLKSSGIL